MCDAFQYCLNLFLISFFATHSQSQGWNGLFALILSYNTLNHRRGCRNRARTRSEVCMYGKSTKALWWWFSIMSKLISRLLCKNTLSVTGMEWSLLQSKWKTREEPVPVAHGFATVGWRLLQKRAIETTTAAAVVFRKEEFGGNDEEIQLRLQSVATHPMTTTVTSLEGGDSYRSAGWTQWWWWWWQWQRC